MANGDGSGRARQELRERLTGYQEDPLALSTSGRGQFEAEITRNQITYRRHRGQRFGAVEDRGRGL